MQETHLRLLNTQPGHDNRPFWAGSAVGQTFTFQDYGSLSGAFSGVVGLDPGYGYSVTYGAKGTTLTVMSMSAAPEPSQASALGLGILGLGAPGPPA